MLTERQKLIVEDIHQSSSEGSIEVIGDEEIRETGQLNGIEEERKFKWARGEYVNEKYPEISKISMITLQLGFVIIIFFARLADFLRKHGFLKVNGKELARERPEQRDFVSLENEFDSMFINNLYRISSDVVNRPIVGVPGAVVRLKDRVSNDYGWTYQFVLFIYLYGVVFFDQTKDTNK